MYILFFFPNGIEDYDRQKTISYRSVSALLPLIHSIFWDLK